MFEERTVQRHAVDNSVGIPGFMVAGLIGGIGGSLIHLLLVVALVVLIIQMLSGRRAVV